MSTCYPLCQQCSYKDTHTRDEHPCETCDFPGDNRLDKRVPELQAQVAKMRKALEEIAKVRRGLDLTDTVEYRADYFFRQADFYQDLARKTLKDLPPT